jgi:hypothetical protein
MDDRTNAANTKGNIYTGVTYHSPTLVVEDLLHELVSKLDTKAIG